MKLNTPINIPQSESIFYCNSKVLTIGSCFSDTIGNKLIEHQFDALVNPFGTVFNPISLCNLIQSAIDNTPIRIEDIGFQTDRYFHFDYHSSFDGLDAESVISKISAARKSVLDFISNTDILILTFGTSIAYRLLDNNKYVSNCHKVPSAQFKREFIPLDEMAPLVKETISRLREINPNLKIILTVSPVRHTKEGLIDNNRSKARLVELCHAIETDMSRVAYFPSYEIMMDELRDYRFYATDLIHPSPFAVDIIWDKFTKTYFDSKAIQKISDMRNLNRAMNHRPFNSVSEGHEKFCQTQLTTIKRLEVHYPEVDFGRFVEHFTKM